MYIFLIDGVVSENVPDFAPAFPGIPIEERYHPDFIAQCIKWDREVPIGYIWNPDTRIFEAPRAPDMLTDATDETTGEE